MSDRYLTIARPAEAELEDRRSRFLAVVRRVDDEPQARSVIERARREHWDARHHCSAFVLGPDGQLARSNDDGEPSGTAGAPILQAVQGRGVSDVVVVVTRWFGGVLLGAGGLVRAYGDAAGQALDEAGTLRRQQLHQVQLSVPVATAARLDHQVRARGFVVVDVDYGDGTAVVIDVRAGAERLAELQALLDAETRGAGQLTVLGRLWVDQPDPPRR